MKAQVLTVSVEQACQIIGVKRSTVFAALRDKRLTRCKIGRRTLVTVASIERLIEASIVHDD